MYANIPCDAMYNTDTGLNTIHLIHAYGLTNIMHQNLQGLQYISACPSLDMMMGVFQFI